MPKPRRKYRRPTPDSLANSALYYLSRYAASEASLRRVLENKIRRAKMQDEALADDLQLQKTLAEAIDTIVATHIRTGVINDAAYAEVKVHSLRRSGRSARAITQKLTQKGIKAYDIEKALYAQEEDDPRQLDLQAAIALAKRRRLGPYRMTSTAPFDTAADAKRRDKEVATMARAGFPFDIIKQVLGGEIEEEELF